MNVLTIVEQKMTQKLLRPKEPDATGTYQYLCKQCSYIHVLTPHDYCNRCRRVQFGGAWQRYINKSTRRIEEQEEIIYAKKRETSGV